ncbi:alpha/beta hydrolase [Defluviimonas sp. D31]|uniref:alpha/beta hydrolase n=1 Tax=Defluviimonas sp. D31 TaxID=3083253 RepID=UPI00296EF77C|nr:alpha/beta hydrolase [Defluviimonas sp. D31]MDW4551245.1 alpha/beta hydrolase [Defluviimonas sp. D31]
MSTVVSIAMLLVACYVALLLAAFVFQSRLVYFPNVPSRSVGPGPDSIGLAFRHLDILTEDGISLVAWYVPAAEPRGTVLFFHGNAGNISHRLESLRQFNELGLATVIFDYRGYGQSEGEISEAGIYRDADAVWRHLTEEMGIPPHRIVLFGRSLGAAVAAYVAGRQKPGALILESGFVSVPDLGAAIYPWLPVRWLARIRFPTDEFLQSSACPVLVIHSRDDEIIPFEQGVKLHAAARLPKAFLEIRGGHNDGFLVSEGRYLKGLDAFVADALGD